MFAVSMFLVIFRPEDVQAFGLKLAELKKSQSFD